ncbi:Hypothetical protein, putative [Bodo saltans]|uniref:Membrane-associated protein n=1 Tax=Bodo saltans TaxID=75058 RepID=A0A0S4JF60_BODSA|nr:Hypothetical protein, putative [Bodo saltans]|eukprot:CUG88806.1 Hypothetical protein, putative [Bodo saltans]
MMSFLVCPLICLHSTLPQRKTKAIIRFTYPSPSTRHHHERKYVPTVPHDSCSTAAPTSSVLHGSQWCSTNGGPATSADANGSSGPPTDDGLHARTSASCANSRGSIATAATNDGLRHHCHGTSADHPTSTYYGRSTAASTTNADPVASASHANCPNGGYSPCRRLLLSACNCTSSTVGDTPTRVASCVVGHRCLHDAAGVVGLMGDLLGRGGGQATP